MEHQELSLANELVNQENYAQAIEVYNGVLKQNARSVVALRGLAICYANLHQWLEALNASINALGYGRYQLEDMDIFINILEASKLSSYISPIEQALIVILDSIWLEGKAASLLTQQLFFKYKTFLESAHLIFDDEAKTFIKDVTLRKLIERTFIKNYTVEKILLLARNEILTLASEGKNIENFIPFLSSLACQSLLNDNLYVKTPSEEKHLTAIEKKAPTAIETLLLKSCYSDFQESVATWREHQTSFQDPKLANINHDLSFYHQVLCNAEQAYDIEILQNETSKKVQRFYTENPYPKWKELIIEPQGLNSFFEMLNISTPHQISALIAGCGTGKQAIEMALTNPSIHITAIDLSPSSLSYAKLMAERYEITNIDFQLLDILKVKSLDRQFEYIMSTGVLHHMENPQAGLNALKKVLKPKGIMLLGLYSKLARKDLHTYRKEVMAEYQQPAQEISSDNIKAWRSQLSDSDKKSIWFHTIDFFNLNGLTDVLIHPQQTEYSLLEIKALLKNEKLKFKRMMFPNAFIDAVANSDVNEASTSLTKWHEFEQKHPYFFAGMYTFLVSH